jgi:hypothetical protein
MTRPAGYILGHTLAAARRLEIQDRQFAGPSERLLHRLALRPADGHRDRQPPRSSARS